MAWMKDFFRRFSGKREGEREPPPGGISGVPERKREFIGTRYEVYGVLGIGGFGIVYLVYDHEAGEVCALKTFKDELLASKKARDSFREEAVKWVNLGRHACIVSALWVDEVSGRLYVEMEFVPQDEAGWTSLEDHLSHTSRAFPLAQTLKWGIHICHGMEHAFSKGIVCHRDLKPQNILIGQGGIARVSDFGLAKSLDSVVGKLRAEAGMGEEGAPAPLCLIAASGCCGTAGYIAPEVYEGKGADVRSDIYSFGLILHQMASGSPFPPFDGSSGDWDERARQSYERQMREKVPRLNTPLCSVIERCLRRDRRERCGSFSEIRQEMEALLRRETGEVITLPEVSENTAAYWNNRGGSLGALGRYDEAVECCKKAIEIDPRYAYAWNNMGVSLDHLGRHDEAVECFKKPIEIDPRYANAWNNMGGSLGHLRRYQEAIECYKKALEIDPRDANAWNNMGVSLDSLGRHDEAIDCYKKAIGIDPRYANAWNNMGGSLDSLGRYEDAIECFKKAIGIDPRLAAAWFNMALAEERAGRLRDAANSYREFLKLSPREYRQQIDRALARLKELEGK
jgi:tetratricopeptide (TPR) repeat protein